LLDANRVVPGVVMVVNRSLNGALMVMMVRRPGECGVAAQKDGDAGNGKRTPGY
jgi:hypothetical protein